MECESAYECMYVCALKLYIFWNLLFLRRLYFYVMSPRAVAAAAAQTAYHFKPKEPVEYYYFFFMCQHWYYYGRTPHIIYADAILHYAHCDITYLFMFRTDFRETNGKNEKTHKTKRISAKFVSHTYQYRILISFVLDVCVSCHLGSFSSYVLFPALFAVLLCTLSLVRSYEWKSI